MKKNNLNLFAVTLVASGIIGIATAGETKGKGMAIAGTVIGAIDLVAVLWFVNMIQAY